ncbi:epsin 2-like protein, partial [Mycena sanguinolenta]
MLKAAARVVRNYAKGYSDVQAKVHEATSTDPGGPSTTQMHEIAQLTHNQGDFVDIMEALQKVLGHKGKDWRRVFKGLTLLDYLLRHGSEDVVLYYSAGTTNRDTANALRNFQHVDGDGKDQGSNVRQKAKDIGNLLLDEGRLRTERNKVGARANRSART